MGDRVAVLKDGLLQQCDTPRRMYDHPDNVFVAGFIGSPAMNLLEVAVTDGGVKFGDQHLPIEREHLAERRQQVATVGRPPRGPRHRRPTARACPSPSTSSRSSAPTPTSTAPPARAPTPTPVRGPRRRPHAPAEGQRRSTWSPTRATCTCSTPRPASASATERSPSTRRWRCPTAGAATSCCPPGVPPRARATRRDGAWAAAPTRRQAGRRVPRWSRGTRDHRRPARPRPARPAVVDPAGGVARGPARGPAPRHLAAHRPLRQGLRPRSSRSRRSRTTWPAASTTCCGCCRSWTSPASSPFGVISGRTDAGRRGARRLPADPAPAVLAALPRAVQPDAAARHRQRLIDALAVLLVRLHLTGFWWGDVSLSNTLFRRDAGAFAAYLVDAETGEIRDQLSDGQREHDLDIARVNIAGELMDLAAGGFLDEVADPVEISSSIVDRYRVAVARAHRARSASRLGDRWRVDERIRRLNELGLRRRRARRSPPTSAAPPSRSSPRSSTRATTRAGCCA